VAFRPLLLLISAELKNELLRTKIGQRIRELRVERGISQEAFAYQAHLDRSYYGRVERGEGGITIDTLATITEALGVTLAEFFRTVG
jgi:transcriptional regulator with XRE-family HTH domain